jgi:DNA-binding transcriptional ArsR family regulator
MNIVGLLASLANKNRWRILEILFDGEICVCKLPLLISITQPAISQHLKVLLEAGLVDVRQEGTKRLYSLSRNGRNVFSTVSACLTKDKQTEKTFEEKNFS